MNESTGQRFSGMAETDQRLSLARVSLALTISGRAFMLDLRDTGLIAALSGINELQHTISGHVAGFGTEVPRYPDEVLWNVLHERAEMYAIGEALTEAVEFANSRTTSN